MGRFLQWASNSTCAVRCQQRGRSLHRVPPHIANDDEQFLPLSWIVIVPGQTTTTGHRPVAPFEPTEVKIVDRQDDAVVVVFQSAEGGEFPMKFQRPQLAGLVSQFEKEVGHGQAVPPPEHRILVADQNVRIVGWQVQKRRDGARRLTFKVELPDQGQTVTLPCVLIPEDVQQLTSDLCLEPDKPNE